MLFPAVLTLREGSPTWQPDLTVRLSFDAHHHDVLDFSTGTQERTKTLAAAQANQAPETGDEPAGGDVQVKPREGSELQGGGEDEVSRARLEREEEAAMVEDENRSDWIPKTASLLACQQGASLSSQRTNICHVMKT